MDQFFTSLNKRQTMLLLTAITFGGQEGVAALEHLAPEDGELLLHRAQEIMHIPREKRIPFLVQEIKKLVKDRRGQLWNAEPEKLAALIQKERGALAEVVLRALPSVLAEAVRAHLPQRPVKLSREVRPQVLDIIRWKLEERLKHSSGSQAAFKFTDVLMLQPRELLTVCDRLGARVLGPAMAGLEDAQREGLIAALPPDMKSLASKAVQANAPRKLPSEEAKEQLAVHDGLKNLAGAIRSAGTQRLARACVSQSAEFAARMLERHRGDFGSLLAKWVRDERSKPASRVTDGGRADIVADLERLAARGLIERPVRLTPQRPALNPPPMRGAPPSREPPPARPPPGGQERSNVVQPPPAPRRDAMAEREARRAGFAGPTGGANSGDSSVRRDPMAERAARRAGALSSREPSRIGPPIDDDPPALSRNARVGPRKDSQGVPPEPGGARVGPPPSREASRVGSRQPPPEVENSRAGSRRPPPEAGAPSRPREGDPRGVPPARVPPRMADRPPAPMDPDGSRVISSPGVRSRGTGVSSSLTNEPERPPRVLSGKTAARPSLASRGGGAGGQRPTRPPSGGNSGRGPRGGSR
ncbi:hypothetical protein [Hyalangium minutum]|uniref:Uncharacterized protein n=1 Tax=Hyalangium minutum TaxID=394096 RepID=A0A085WVT0_9BACT|nr:hypothetical protein [Hyalangium minutum]KFE71793.1 hypothetical protein DB31_0054 [Hyalangium minutum]